MKKLAVILFAALPVLGHHSFHGTYSEDAPKLRAEGTVKQFLLRNPHSFASVEDDQFKDDKGAPVVWQIEWSAGGRLTSEGVTRDTLKPGDHVIVTGNQGRNPLDHRLYLRTLDRPSDGFHVENSVFVPFIGMAPTILK